MKTTETDVQIKKSVNFEIFKYLHERRIYKCK